MKQRLPGVRWEQTSICENWASGEKVLELDLFPDWYCMSLHSQCVRENENLAVLLLCLLLTHRSAWPSRWHHTCETFTAGLAEDGRGEKSALGWWQRQQREPEHNTLCDSDGRESQPGSQSWAFFPVRDRSRKLGSRVQLTRHMCHFNSHYRSYDAFTSAEPLRYPSQAEWPSVNGPQYKGCIK